MKFGRLSESDEMMTTTLLKQQLFFGLLTVLVILGDFFGAWNYFRQVLEPIVFQSQLPIVRLYTSISQAAGQLKNVWQNSQKFTALQLQYSQALFELEELQSVRAENQELRRMLENTDRTLAKTIIASPVISFAQPTLLVGTADGIEAHAAVVSRGTLLGFLTEVGQRSSRVALLTEQNNLPVLVQTENGTQGLLVGDGRTIWLTEVPADAKVSYGERVVTVGQQGIAKGLLIGVVGNNETLPQDAVQRLQVKQLVSFFTTSIVEVY